MGLGSFPSPAARGVRSLSAPSSGPMMSAQVLTHAGPDFKMGLESLRRPSPKKGEVLVRVRAVGLCHTDLHVMKAEVGEIKVTDDAKDVRAAAGA